MSTVAKKSRSGVLFCKFRLSKMASLKTNRNKKLTGWGIVACPVIEAIARPDLEDVLRTRSPGKVVTGRLSVRTSSGIMMVSILDRIDP